VGFRGGIGGRVGRVGAGRVGVGAFGRRLGIWFRLEIGHVGAVASVFDGDEFAVGGVLAEDAVADDGGVDEFVRLLDGELVGGEFVGHVHSSRRGAGRGAVDDLEVGAVFADTQGDGVVEPHRVDAARVDVAEVVDDFAKSGVLVVAE